MAQSGDAGRRHDAAYFDKQWEALRERGKQSDDAFRRRWFYWQKELAGRAPYSAWLAVPCNLSDYGSRPLPPGTPYWASPFIGIVSPDPSGQPLAGALNQLYARVFNLGAATAAPTRVEFYWADPSVGLGAADAHFIGAETVEIAPMSSKVVTCSTPWIPSYLNGGHECAFVSAHNHVLDPLLLPFQPWADRHVGQRNLSVLPAVAQAFRLWIPGAAAGRLGQLHAFALRARSLAGMPLGPNAVQRLEAAAHVVLQGLRRLPQGAAAHAARQIDVAARRIDAQQVLAGARWLEAGRPDCSSADRQARPVAADAGALGEVLLNQDAPAAAMARQVELQFKAVDLAMDEIAVVNVTYVCAGVVEGGYVLVLAHPAWFKSSVSQALAAGHNEGGSMNTPTPHGSFPPHERDEMRLRELVIRFNPLARATLELAMQLAPLLPIESPQRLGTALRVGGEAVDSAFLLQFVKGMLPITDEADLVLKISTVLKLASAHGEAHRPTLNAATARFLDQLNSVEPGARGPIPVLYGRRSLFRLDDATKGD